MSFCENNIARLENHWSASKCDYLCLPAKLTPDVILVHMDFSVFADVGDTAIAAHPGFRKTPMTPSRENKFGLLTLRKNSDRHIDVAAEHQRMSLFREKPCDQPFIGV